MMNVRIRKNGAVACHATLCIPLSAGTVWGQIRDFHRFAQQDFFHARIKIDGDIPRSGAALIMAHRFAFIRISRRGRILFWRENVGYSFSDLSLSGNQQGFPHVFSYRIEPLTAIECNLHVHVRGKWTAYWLPRWIARLWLFWVFRHIILSVENQFLAYLLWRKKNKVPNTL